MNLCQDGCWQVDWRPMIRRLIADHAGGTSIGAMAMRFHRGLAEAVGSMVRRFADVPVVLSGGVFQNRVLSELLAAQLNGHAMPVGFPARVPANDGGLAVGQLAVAVSIDQE
jgi:hydrogenase maturation protein HypF